MCGRARCTLAVQDVGRAAGFRAPLRSVDADRYRPSYNVAPGRYMPVVRHMQAGEATDEVSTEPVVHCMKWGLIPSFTKRNEKPDHYRMFNARSESVHLKPTFSRLLKRQNRCMATVEGFYEWKKDGTKRQPYYLHFKDGRPLVFAALYDSWKNEVGDVLHTFTILTTRNSKAIGWLHAGKPIRVHFNKLLSRRLGIPDFTVYADRMPVILPTEAAVNSWLNDELTEASLHKITLPYEGSDLVWNPVTPEMGKPSFDGPECVQELKPQLAKESPIFQLFGKRKHAANLSKDNEETVGEISETTKHPPSADCCGASTGVKDEHLESDEDKKALQAGMEPDEDVTQALQKEDTEGREGSLEGNNHRSHDPACMSEVKEEVSEEDISVKNETPEEGLAVKQEVHGSGFAGEREVHEEDASKEEVHEEDFDVKNAVPQNGNTNKEEVHGTDPDEHKRASSPEAVTTRNEPEAKKRRVSVSPRSSKKTSGRGAGKATLSNKQSSLHSFFGKK